MNSISNSNWEAAFLHSILFSDHKILGTQSHFREPFWEQHLLKLISVLVAQPMVQNWVSASWEGRFSVSHGCMFCGIHRIWAQMHSRCWIACRMGSGACVPHSLCPCQRIADSGIESGCLCVLCRMHRLGHGTTLFLKHLTLMNEWLKSADLNRESCSLGCCLKMISYWRTKYIFFWVEIYSERLLSANEK